MAFGVALLAASPGLGQDACERFRWDVTHEHALFLGAAVPLAAGRQEDAAPEVQLDRLYELVLSPAGEVAFAVPPSQKNPAQNAFAGMMRFHVPRAGRYRVSLGGRTWVDVSAQRKLLSPADFGGAEGCNAPHKVVVYDFPEDGDVTLELSGASDRQIRMTLTAVVP